MRCSAAHKLNFVHSLEIEYTESGTSARARGPLDSDRALIIVWMKYNIMAYSGWPKSCFYSLSAWQPAIFVYSQLEVSITAPSTIHRLQFTFIEWNEFASQRTHVIYVHKFSFYSTKLCGRHRGSSDSDMVSILSTLCHFMCVPHKWLSGAVVARQLFLFIFFVFWC